MSFIKDNLFDVFTLIALLIGVFSIYIVDNFYYSNQDLSCFVFWLGAATIFLLIGFILKFYRYAEGP